MTELKSVRRVFDLLSLFTRDNTNLGVTEAARQLKVDKSSASRLMTTLVSVGILRRIEETRKYCLDKKVLDLAIGYLSGVDLEYVAFPYMKELSEKTGQLILLHIRKDDKRIIIKWIESTQKIRLVFDKDHLCGPLHAGAPGKILLACLSDNQIEQIVSISGLPRYTSQTITTKNKLHKEIFKIRQRDIAVSHGEQIEHAATVAAPVRNYTGEAIAAISISWLEFGTMADKENIYESLVKECASRLSLQLGYKLHQQLV